MKETLQRILATVPIARKRFLGRLRRSAQENLRKEEMKLLERERTPKNTDPSLHFKKRLKNFNDDKIYATEH